MRLRWTIILILLNGVLLWAIAHRLAQPAATEAFEAQIRSFLPLQKSQWDAFAVSDAAGAWSASRDQWGRWWLKSPFEWPARYERFARMVAFLTTLKIESAFSTTELTRVGQSLRSYGLETPHAILKVSSLGQTLTYKVGNPTPLGNKRYVLSPSEEEIWVVDGELMEFLITDTTALRQEGFFPFETVELESVTVQLDSLEMRLERKAAASQWQLKYKEGTFALKEGIWDDWLNSLSGQTPTQFETLDAEKQGLKTPAGRLIFKTLYGRRALLMGGLASPKSRWVQWEGSKSVFTLSEDLLGQLSLGKLLPSQAFAGANFDKLVWKTPQEELRLEKDASGNYQIIEGSSRIPTDPAKVEKYRLYMVSLEAIPAEETLGLSPEAPRLELEEAGNTTIYYFSTDLMSVGQSGIRYNFQNAYLPPSRAQLEDKRMAKFPEGDFLAAGLRGKGGDFVFEKDSPLTQSLLALIKAPDVKNFATDTVAEIPEETFTLFIRWEGVEKTIRFWKTDRVWAEIDSRRFEPTQAWVAFFENALTLPPQP